MKIEISVPEESSYFFYKLRKILDPKYASQCYSDYPNHLRAISLIIYTVGLNVKKKNNI